MRFLLELSAAERMYLLEMLAKRLTKDEHAERVVASIMDAKPAYDHRPQSRRFAAYQELMAMFQHEPDTPAVHEMLLKILDGEMPDPRTGEKRVIDD